MKRKSIVLALLAVFAISSIAFAAVKTFGHVSVDVPSGWTAAEDGTTVSLTADDNSAAITVTVETNDGTDVALIAKEYAKQFKASEPVFEDDVYTMTFKNANDIDCNVVISGDGDMYVMLVMIGEHPQMEQIVDSLEFN
ncbi:MAG: hypothetical protein EOM02_12155 [Synergistales bacterium]|nr:hypothetical protein [Dethiosulfovibrio sp.]NCC97570.1 hypothetical protein [Synergistales bacterium]